MKQFQLKFDKPVCQGYCMLVFTSFVMPKLVWVSLLRDISPALFQIMPVLLGVFAWTFFEYILHRFWMHGHRDAAADERDLLNHRHHHTHPTDIRITRAQRMAALFVVTGIMALGFWMNNWFSLASGFIMGAVIYLNMHWVLHQGWAHRVLPGLQEQHVLHHLKHPDHAFGVTTGIWDRLFGTRAPSTTVITEKVYRFYIDGKVTRPDRN
jgi:sterol desaturase/sphingolipid hydroxylase (fatty acid hydroxylase superfamily)